MKHATFALTIASTLGFICLGLFFGLVSIGSLYLWLDTGSYSPLLHEFIFACVTALAFAASLSVVVTGVLQMRVARPKLTKITACLTLSWPIFTFGTFAIVVMILGVGTDLSLSYAKTFAGECLKTMVRFLGMISLILLLPAARNGLFRYQRKSQRQSPV